MAKINISENRDKQKLAIGDWVLIGDTPVLGVVYTPQAGLAQVLAINVNDANRWSDAEAFMSSEDIGNACIDKIIGHRKWRKVNVTITVE